jgi:uncharacterized repeat protein (TIGR03803 family)
LEVLHSFNGADGAQPVASLVQAGNGSLYGTTHTGWTANLGTIFRITPAGEFESILSFDGATGANPRGALVEGGDDALYGTTENGGAMDMGTVFRLTVDGALTTLVSFDGGNGAHPRAGLLPAGNGAFHGTTDGPGYGTVFRVDPDGKLVTVMTFYWTNGGSPSGLVLGLDGRLYGATSGGGDNGDGVVYRVATDGDWQTLRSFRYGFPPNHGPAQPESGLTLGCDGYFYGTTAVGGAGNAIGQDAGTIYKITPAGELTLLVSLNNRNGANPLAPLTLGADGNFYGTTWSGGPEWDPQVSNYGWGTVFQVTPGGALTVLAAFSGPDGGQPEGGVIFGRDRHIYGTTTIGGAHDRGTVFRVAMSATHASYAVWAASFGLSGDDAAPERDIDGDGLPSGAEYLLGGSPIAASPETAPRVTRVNGELVFRFQRIDAAETPDLEGTVEAGPDLLTWPHVFVIGASTAASTPGVTILENGDEPDEVRVTISATEGPTFFFRLRTTITP